MSGAPPPPAPPSPAPPPPPPPPGGAVIRLEGVSKWFGDLVAVSEVTFSLGRGVTALLGPNGAGKSTVLRLMAGLTSPSQGSVRVLDRDPHRDLELTARVGLVPQQEAMFEALDAYEQVLLAARLQRLADPAGAARRALAQVELDPDDPRRIGAYSKGMRQRVKVAQALVHDPEVVFLDEPLTGLDPRQRRHLIELFQRLGEEGRCVVVSSHVLDEVERFGSRVLVIAQGRLAAEGDFRAIRTLMDDRPHRLRLRSDKARAVTTALLATGAVSGVTLVDEGTALVETADAPRFRATVARCAAREGARLLEVAPLDDDLESVFRYLVER